MTTRTIQTRRNRQTGTVIEIFDRGQEPATLTDPNPQRWETICVDHGTVCSHETLELARAFAAAPLEWCEECMALEGI